MFCHKRETKVTHLHEIFLFWTLELNTLDPITVNCVYSIFRYFKRTGKEVVFFRLKHRLIFFAVQDKLSIELAEWVLAVAPKAQYHLNEFYELTERRH